MDKEIENLTIDDLINESEGFLNKPCINMYFKLEGRDSELSLLKESLYKKRLKNTLLVGNPGSGKTAIVEEFAKISINNCSVLEFNITSLLAGTRYRGDLELKVDKILKLITDFNRYNTDKPIVLFIDEIHTLMQKTCGIESSSISDLLKTSLSKGDIIVIGATTNDEYNRYIKPDLAITRRFSPIHINDLSDDIVIKILKNFMINNIDDEICEYIVNESKKIKRGVNPDISIEILDRVQARAKLRRIKITTALVDEIIEIMM